jgi:hypothetical protein
VVEIPRKEKAGRPAPDAGEKAVVALRPEDWHVGPLIDEDPTNAAARDQGLAREVVDVIRRGAVVDLWLEGGAGERIIATLYRDEYDETLLGMGHKVRVRPKPGVARYFLGGVG